MQIKNACVGNIDYGQKYSIQRLGFFNTLVFSCFIFCLSGFTCYSLLRKEYPK